MARFEGLIQPRPADSKGGVLYRLRPQDAEYRMETLVRPGTFIYPNGIAISPDLGKPTCFVTSS